MDTTNYISAEILIKEEDLDKNIKIINSFENFKKERGKKDKENNNINGNEEEIMSCEIKINGELIIFDYNYKFDKTGRYNIIYSFPTELTNVNYMFCDCTNITNIDLSHFNTQKITNMSYMFSKCYSLRNIDFSNFNTQNVTDMSYMFEGCNSLQNIDLSNFNAPMLQI